MKVAVTEVNVKESFPKLMRSTKSGNIVLMTEEGIGVILVSNIDSWRIGDTSNSFLIEFFEDFNGVLTLKND